MGLLNKLFKKNKAKDTYKVYENDCRYCFAFEQRSETAYNPDIKTGWYEELDQMVLSNHKRCKYKSL